MSKLQIYPNHQTYLKFKTKEFRQYQFKIVETALFFNTLVALPTGLGKTFIATNVILNYYLWFKKGLIFFLAPNRPLVNQQVEGIREVPFFDPEDICELTGSTHQNRRRPMYDEKRIFFMTP